MQKEKNILVRFFSTQVFCFDKYIKNLVNGEGSMGNVK